MSAWTGLLEEPAAPDDRLAGARERRAGPVTVAVSTGAGGIAGAARVAVRGPGLRALEVALRDLDDLAGNARRVSAAVDQARAEGVLGEEVPVRVVLPPTEPGHGWLAAADEIAAMELHLGLRTGAVETDLLPPAPIVAAWIDAALDRELPFACGGGPHPAVRRPDGHGVLNLLLATELLFEGGARNEAEQLLEQTAERALADRVSSIESPRPGRWLTAVATPSSARVAEEIDRLLETR